MDQVYEKFCKTIAREFKVKLSEITPSANFVDDFAADSLDIIEFMVVVEGEFGIKIENEALRSVKSVQEAYTLLIKRIQERDIGISDGTNTN